MSTKLVILGLLRERPLYGYEIKHIIEEHMGDWTSIAFGSIYFALDKLTQEGYLEIVGTEQAGSRPSRKIYQITQSGKEEFLRLLRNVWRDVERNYYVMDIGLYFMEALSGEEVKGFLLGRIEQLEESLQHIDTHRDEQVEYISHLLDNPEISKSVNKDIILKIKAVFAHTELHLKAELDWTKDLLKILC